jgi:hypothetical protein
MATCLDATQCSRIFRVSFTNAERSDRVDCQDAQSCHLDVVLFLEELRYSRKVVAKDRPGATCRSPKLIIIRFSVSL